MFNSSKFRFVDIEESNYLVFFIVLFLTMMKKIVKFYKMHHINLISSKIKTMYIITILLLDFLFFYSRGIPQRVG